MCSTAILQIRPQRLREINLLKVLSVGLRPEFQMIPLLQKPLLRFVSELHRAETIGLEGGMADGTGVLMSTFSGVMTITVHLHPYRWTCTTSHSLETSSGAM